MLEAFPIRLGGEVDLDTVTVDLLATVNRAPQPAHASLWLKQPALSARRVWRPR